jgi:hypothetical protein
MPSLLLGSYRDYPLHPLHPQHRNDINHLICYTIPYICPSTPNIIT